MKLKTELYLTAEEKLPKSGKQIIGQVNGDEIVVYQAYNRWIAKYAVEHQVLGGSNFSYSRMSWIKPNFLWMMFRCGWASKENQERVLALWLRKADFEVILSQAVRSSFKAEDYSDRDAWKLDMERKEVRLQWDPDHDPYGNKMGRRAIQLGLKGNMLEAFGREMVTGIEDITDFVKEQKVWVDDKQLDKLEVPAEQVYDVQNTVLERIVGIVKPY
ncbi:hypothetical protein HNQ91_001206 [Filimonas zeae]|uniref:DUF4291 domain-containing protein n=1 Tax=Filimonas zeae TaxID=1737353 RepID=A0A917ITM3_9BACT|nr:DUF4291 domain-containing protein [Filimonas zeae]MDR6338184.1 hypothetical protein [Filimonas zeae]GGH62131.1 hypothetical protein GCM10011379_11800 [Filimonas zeae]